MISFSFSNDSHCLFVNEAGVKVLLWVDDLLVRSLRADTDTFHDALEASLNAERVLGSTYLMITTLSTVG